LEYVDWSLKEVVIGGNTLSPEIIGGVYSELLIGLESKLVKLTFGGNFVTKPLHALFAKEDLGNDSAGFTTIKNRGKATLNALWEHAERGKSSLVDRGSFRSRFEVVP